MCDSVLHRMLWYTKHLHSCCRRTLRSKFQCTTTPTVGWQDQSHLWTKRLAEHSRGKRKRFANLLSSKINHCKLISRCSHTAHVIDLHLCPREGQGQPYQAMSPNPKYWKMPKISFRFKIYIPASGLWRSPNFLDQLSLAEIRRAAERLVKCEHMHGSKMRFPIRVRETVEDFWRPTMMKKISLCSEEREINRGVVGRRFGILC